MSLSIRFFNVGHGDSILISHSGTGEPRYIVVDCMTGGTARAGVPPVCAFLHESRVRRIDLLVVSHIHRDHYTGIECLLKDFAIERILIPPLFGTKDVRAKQLFEKHRDAIKSIVTRASDPELLRCCRSIASLFAHLYEHPEVVEEASGPCSIVRIAGAPELALEVCLPLKVVRGQVMALVERGDFEYDSLPDNASVAVAVQYCGQRIVLTGDSPLDQWSEHRRMMLRSGMTSVSATGMKASHHGSRSNSDEALFRYLLAEPLSGRPLVVSAGGHHHPDGEVLALAGKLGLSPYCTNLAPRCRSGGEDELDDRLGELPSEVVAFLRHLEVRQPPGPCQGDIELLVAADGSLDVKSSSNAPCCYRPFAGTA